MSDTEVSGRYKWESEMWIQCSCGDEMEAEGFDGDIGETKYICGTCGNSVIEEQIVIDKTRAGLLEELTEDIRAFYHRHRNLSPEAKRMAHEYMKPVVTLADYLRGVERNFSRGRGIHFWEP